MTMADRYPKLVEWSDEDGCFIGTSPGLILGGCHGDDPKKVFAELIEIIEEVVAIHIADGRPLPEPLRVSEIAVP